MTLMRFYQIVCDGCGENHNPLLSDEREFDVKQAAMSDGWAVDTFLVGGSSQEILCPRCILRYDEWLTSRPWPVNTHWYQQAQVDRQVADLGPSAS